MDLEVVQPLWISIDQSNNYRKEFSWLHFDNEPRVQEGQLVKDQQFYRPISLIHLIFSRKCNEQQHGYDSSIPFKAIWYLDKDKQLPQEEKTSWIKGPIFLKSVLAIETVLEPHFNLGDKENPSIISSLQKKFSARIDPSIFASIAPGL